MEPSTRRTPASRPSRVPAWLRVLIPTVLILLWFGAFASTIGMRRYRARLDDQRRVPFDAIPLGGTRGMAQVQMAR